MPGVTPAHRTESVVNENSMSQESNSGDRDAPGQGVPGDTQHVRGVPEPVLSAEDAEDERMKKCSYIFKTDGVRLFSGDHVTGETLQHHLEEILSTLDLWFSTARVTSDRNKFFLAHTLVKGRARELLHDLARTYRAKYEAKEGPLSPPWSEVVETLRNLTVHTAETPLQLNSKIKQTTLLGLALESNPPLPLVSAFDKLERLISKRPVEFDSLSLLDLYLEACPADILRRVKQVTVGNGSISEVSDPVQLKNNILSYSELFEQLVKKAKLGGVKEGAHVNASRPAGNNHRANKKRRHDAGQPSGSEPRDKKPKADQTAYLATLPEKEKRVSFQRGMHVFVDGVSPQDIVKRLQAGQCVICKSEQHMVNQCPQRNQKFSAKAYYSYYPANYKGKKH